MLLRRRVVWEFRVAHITCKPTIIRGIAAFTAPNFFLRQNQVSRCMPNARFRTGMRRRTARPDRDWLSIDVHALAAIIHVARCAQSTADRRHRSGCSVLLDRLPAAVTFRGVP